MKWVDRIFENKIDDKQYGGGVVTSTTDALFEMIHHWCEAIISMVKKVITQIVRPFVHICNVYSETGVFPDKMKIAKVVPLFKFGEENVFTNYRPLSLLLQFSRILEKIYNERMDTFLNNHDILSTSQYGFRSNMSTSHALFRIGRRNYKFTGL